MDDLRDIEIVGMAPEGIELAEAKPPISFKHLPGDIVEIEGMRYSGDLFRHFAAPEEGALYRIWRSGDDVLFRVIREDSAAPVLVQAVTDVDGQTVIVLIPFMGDQPGALGEYNRIIREAITPSFPDWDRIGWGIDTDIAGQPYIMHDSIIRREDE